MAMASVGVLEAKNHFAQLLQRSERGEEITITRRGRAVARLMPAAGRPEPEAMLARFLRLRERARCSGIAKFDWAQWRAYRDQGRP